MTKVDLLFNEKNVYTMNSLPANKDEKIIYVFRDTTEDNGEWYIHKVLYIGISIDASGRLNASHNKKNLPRGY